MLTAVTAALEKATAGVETSPVADRVGTLLERVAAPLRKVPDGRSMLSGTTVGHPVHPLLVTVPIGAWTSALLLDLTRNNRRAARTLVGIGIVAALPTAVTGASDWLDTEGAERRIGTTHALLNTMATTAYVASWVLRPRRAKTGVALGVVGAGLVSAGGWLGGHLTYSLGVGVDTNAFDTGPGDWTPLEAGVRAGEATLAEVGGTRLAVTVLDGVPAIVADRCSHRGGPLSEGTVADGCFSCPWHGSRFDARTGQVRRGPASIPQPSYESRPSDDGFEVRRREARALRNNAV